MKRGFVGPSIFPLLLGDSKSQNNPLNLFSYSSQICDQCAIGMCATDQNQEGLREIIEGWRDSTFHSPILNCFWKLLLCFFIWKIWKERNRIIFHSSHLDWKIVWKHIHDNIRETIHLQHWKEEDLSCPPQEKCILDNWNINFNRHPSRKLQRSQTKGGPSYWSPPSLGFIKLNFDGSSKGNPGPAGFRVVLRNNQGNIMLISASSIGHNSNNMQTYGGS